VKNAELIVWYASFFIEAALIVRLLLCRVKLRMFLAYLMFDLPRWLILAGIDRWCVDGAYRTAWVITEPISIVLLACVGIEAFAVAFNVSLRRYVYYLAGGFVLAIVAIVPPLTDLPDERFFLARVIVAALIVLSTVAMGAARAGAHGAILAGFCVFDIVQNVAIIQGARGDITPGALLVFEQTACLVLWLAHTPIIARQTSDYQS
jgi:hypothetical protein